MTEKTYEIIYVGVLIIWFVTLVAMFISIICYSLPLMTTFLAINWIALFSLYALDYKKNSLIKRN